MDPFADITNATQQGEHVPRPSRAQLLLATFLALLCWLYLAALSPDYYRLMNDRNLGNQLAKGQQILFGFHPYVHVDSSVYGPAIFYLSALAQILSGHRLIGEIVLIFCGYLAAYLLAFYTFARFTVRRWLLLLYAALAILTLPIFHKYHILLPQSIFFAGLFHATISGESHRTPLILGLSCVLAGIFRVDFGIYAAISSVLLVLVQNRTTTRSPIVALGRFFGTIACLLAPWLIFLAASGDPWNIAMTTLHTTTGALQGNAMPLPPFDFGQPPLGPRNSLVLYFWLFRCIPWIVLSAVAIGMYRRRPPTSAPSHIDTTSTKRDTFIFMSSIFAILVYFQASHRIDISHLKQGFFAGLFVLFLAIARWWPEPECLSPRTKLALTVLLVTCIAIIGRGLLIEPLIDIKTFSARDQWHKLTTLTMTRSAALDTGPPSLRMERLAKTRRFTGPEDPVLFLPSDSPSYFFSGRHFETPQGWWNPGRFNAPGSQQRFIRSLITTRLIVDYPPELYDGDPLKNARNYADEVMRHIYQDFGIIGVAGTYVFLSRDRLLLSRADSPDLALRRFPELDASARQVDDSEDGCIQGYRVTHVNTLAVTPSMRGFAMPVGGHLLLTIEGCRSTETGVVRAMIGLVDDDSAYLVTRNDNPHPAGSFSGYQPIGTRTVPPGDYDLVFFLPDAGFVPTAPGTTLQGETTGISMLIR